MESSCSEQGTGITIVLLGAEYGSANFLAIRDLEQRLISDIGSASTGLLVDCGAMIYLSCEFLNALLRCHQQAKCMSRRIRFCTLSPLAREALAITRLDSLWDISETRQEAINAMQGNRSLPCSF